MRRLYGEEFLGITTDGLTDVEQFNRQLLARIDIPLN